MRAAILATVTFLGALSSCSGGGASGTPQDGPGNPPPVGAFLAQDGLVVVEFESSPDAGGGDWAQESSMAGFTGAGYLTWTGPNLYQTPGQDPFGFDFVLEEAGRYHFRLHNRHDHPDSTLANDLWVRMDGGDWIKAFSWQRGQWTWATQHEFSHDNKPPAEYTLAAGAHRIEFSGRSNGFSVDRFHLYLDGHGSPEDTSHPESPRQAGLTPPLAALALDSETQGTRLVELTGGPTDGTWEFAAGDLVDGGQPSDTTVTVAVPASEFVGVSRAGRDLVISPAGTPLRIVGSLREGHRAPVIYVGGGDFESATFVLRDAGSFAVARIPLERVEGTLRGAFKSPGAGTFSASVEVDGRTLVRTTIACLPAALD